IELEGGRENMTMAEIYKIAGFNKVEKINIGFVTKFLFWLRELIGRAMGWDDDKELLESNSYISRLSDDQKADSLLESGQMSDDTRILYCYKDELLGEIINKTVHCFWLMASEKTKAGYNLISAVYVKRLNWRTPIYMALVTPMLKWIIYPSILKDVKRRWAREFPDNTADLQDELARR
ncbi:MAG: DUF2867 domain-containing protein, partial [Pyrinomonadaceae bacterium]|nr:DUF2867 domain-containing protein [Pyrinomonadaceae bacterium]